MKYSRQRELVLRALRENIVHPTADYIHTILKKELPSISLATVYRNLNLLADCGEILKINGLDGAVHFDYNTHKHYHFICTKCNKVYDVPEDVAPNIRNNVNEQTGLTVLSSDITFKGICRDCQYTN